MKIEHWMPRNPKGSAARPQSADGHLLWSNLLGVCLGTSFESERTVTHCDTSRGNADLFLHPVDGQGPDPRNHLRYTAAGKVESAEPNPRVDADIHALNLNAPHIRRGRTEVLDGIRRRLERSNFSTNELKRIAREYQVISGTRTPEHAEVVRYYVCKKLCSRGETI